MSVTINAAVCSNVGRVRTNNEDNFYFDGMYMDETNRDRGGIFTQNFSHRQMVFAVCDGMGGTARGEDASFCAVRKLKEFAQSGKRVNEPSVLKPVIQNISDAVEDECRGSGTTIVMVSVNDGVACISHVGDSRVYTMQNGTLRRATVDHSEVQRMYSMGLITREQMATHPKRNMINQFLGMPKSEAMVAPGFTDGVVLQIGMRFLLCSDGLTDMVSDDVIGDVMSANLSAEESCTVLVRKALENGGKDNVTVMILDVTDADEQQIARAAAAASKTHKKKSADPKKVKELTLIKNISLAGMIVGAFGLLLNMILMFI